MYNDNYIIHLIGINDLKKQANENKQTNKK